MPEGVVLEKGKETEIPDDAVALFTWRHKDFDDPIGCPRLTPELMAVPEPNSWNHLVHGRAAVIAAHMAETRPPTSDGAPLFIPTPRPFSRPRWILGI